METIYSIVEGNFDDYRHFYQEIIRRKIQVFIKLLLCLISWLVGWLVFVHSMNVRINKTVRKIERRVL